MSDQSGPHAPNPVGPPGWVVGQRRRAPWGLVAGVSALALLGLTSLGAAGAFAVGALERTWATDVAPHAPVSPAAATPGPSPSPTPSPDATPARLLPPVTATTKGEHAWMQTQSDTSPVAFDPCAPVRWSLNPDGMPEGAQPLVEAAAADVSKRTGLQFEFTGLTHERPNPDAEYIFRGPVAITWGDDDADPELAGDVAGLGGANAFETAGGWLEYGGGSIVLDREDAQYWLDEDEADEVQLLIMHELGHVVGLAHVDDSEELMYPVADEDGWGPGDLEGLAILGRGAAASQISAAVMRSKSEGA